jgi:hypothetical protein
MRRQASRPCAMKGIARCSRRQKEDACPSSIDCMHCPARSISSWAQSLGGSIRSARGRPDRTAHDRGAYPGERRSRPRRPSRRWSSWPCHALPPRSLTLPSFPWAPSWLARGTLAARRPVARPARLLAAWPLVLVWRRQLLLELHKRWLRPRLLQRKRLALLLLIQQL